MQAIYPELNSMPEPQVREFLCECAEYALRVAGVDEPYCIECIDATRRWAAEATKNPTITGVTNADSHNGTIASHIMNSPDVRAARHAAIEAIQEARSSRQPVRPEYSPVFSAMEAAVSVTAIYLNSAIVGTLGNAKDAISRMQYRGQITEMINKADREAWTQITQLLDEFKAKKTREAE